jgi:predicted metal-dependent peptidase
MNTYPIDLTNNDTYQRAMRRVARYAPLAYGKLLSLKLLATTNTPFGATDGRHLWLNPNGLAKLERTSDPVGYCAFLLLHEALHAQLSHATRLRKLTNLDIANRAADYIINAIIAKLNSDALAAGAKVIPFPLIDGVLIDPDLSRDRHVVELYNILLDEQRKQPQPQPQPDDNETEDCDDDSESDAVAEADPADDADDEEDSAAPQDGVDEDSSDDDGDQADADADAGSDGDSDDECGGGANDEPTSDADILKDFVGTDGDSGDLAEPQLDEGESLEDFERSVDEDNESIELNEQMAEAAGTGGGSGFREMAQHRREWKGLDWADYVKDWMKDKLDAGWNKPLNVRTFAATGLVDDDRESDNVGELAVVVDTSISVPSSVVREMLDATQDALDTLRPKAIHLLSFDHRVYPYGELTSGDTVPDKLAGGGGTLFRPVFEHIATNAPDVDGVIFLTDGDAADWEDVVEPQAPVLWLDWNSRVTRQYPFGEVIKVSQR